MDQSYNALLYVNLYISWETRRDANTHVHTPPLTSLLNSTCIFRHLDGFEATSGCTFCICKIFKQLLATLSHSRSFQRT